MEEEAPPTKEELDEIYNKRKIQKEKALVIQQRALVDEDKFNRVLPMYIERSKLLYDLNMAKKASDSLSHDINNLNQKIKNNCCHFKYLEKNNCCHFKYLEKNNCCHFKYLDKWVYNCPGCGTLLCTDGTLLCTDVNSTYSQVFDLYVNKN